MAIRVTSGPLATNVDDMAQVMRAWWVEKMFTRDPTVYFKPFDEDIYANGRRSSTAETEGKRNEKGDGVCETEKPRIGYFMTDNWYVYVHLLEHTR